MEILRLHPLSQLELERAPATFLDTLFGETLSFPHNGRLGKELAERIVRGGYPEAHNAHPEDGKTGTPITSTR